MKKLLLICLLSFSSVGFAAVAVYNPDYTYGAPQQSQVQVQSQYPQYQPRPMPSIFTGAGPYVGISGGGSVVIGPENFNDFFIWGNSGGWAPAWRGYAGFNIIRFFAIEGGFSQYGDTTFPCTNISNCTVHGTDAWDIMGKFILPIRTYNPNVNVEFYLKAGAAYVTTNVDMDIPNQNFSSSGWTPAYGIGVTFYFYRYIGLDMSWLGFYGQDATVDFNGLHGTYIPRTSLFTLGLVFKLPLQ